MVATVRTAFAPEGQAEATAQWRRVADGLRGSSGDALADAAHPEGPWARSAGDNGRERLDRRADVVRPVGAILMKRRDERQAAGRQARAKSLNRKGDQGRRPARPGSGPAA